jgi:translation initiation factor 2 alpha subunit (eIF-2alpha)
MREYHEGDIVLCTVIDVVKTTVFVETIDGRKGSIVFSEVAPGRIRNIRDYVVPKKVIACKILSMGQDHLFLSLRRVKEKERKELIELYKKERSTESLVKKIIGEKAIEIIKKINEKTSLIELFEKAKQNPKVLEEYFTKSETEKIAVILVEKKEKEKEIKKEFSLSCKESDGINKIKSLLGSHSNIYYLGSSKFMIKEISSNLKQADTKINQVLETIEKNAKKQKCEFALKK